MEEEWVKAEENGQVEMICINRRTKKLKKILTEKRKEKKSF